MVGEVFAGFSAFKSMLDMAKALKDMNDASIRNAAVIELTEKILAAQETQAGLLQHIGALEKELADFKTWETEKQRYELKPLGNGFAYVLKSDAQGGEAPHQICANCYSRGKKSFLATVPNNSARMALGMGRVYRCTECKAEV